MEHKYISHNLKTSFLFPVQLRLESSTRVEDEYVLDRGNNTLKPEDWIRGIRVCTRTEKSIHAQFSCSINGFSLTEHSSQLWPIRTFTVHTHTLSLQKFALQCEKTAVKTPEW